MLTYQKLTKKMNENKVFIILKIVGSLRYNHVKFLKIFIQTTFLGSK